MSCRRIAPHVRSEQLHQKRVVQFEFEDESHNGTGLAGHESGLRSRGRIHMNPVGSPGWPSWFRPQLEQEGAPAISALAGPPAPAQLVLTRRPGTRLLLKPWLFLLIEPGIGTIPEGGCRSVNGPGPSTPLNELRLDCTGRLSQPTAVFYLQSLTICFMPSSMAPVNTSMSSVVS